MAQYLVSVGVTIIAYAFATLGLTVVGPFSGYLSIAAGAFAGVGGYTYAVLATSLGLPAVVAALAAITMTGLLSALVGLVVYRLRGPAHLLATLAVQLVVVEILRRWRTVTKGDAGLGPAPRLVADMSSQELLFWATGLLIVGSLGVHAWTRSGAGLRARAVRDDWEVAEASGVNILRGVAETFGISGALLGIGGVVLAMHLRFIQPSVFGITLSITVLVMAILGGANVLGALGSAVGLLVVPELVYRYMDLPGVQLTAFQTIIYGVVLVAVMLARPAGLFPEHRLKFNHDDTIEVVP